MGQRKRELIAANRSGKRSKAIDRVSRVPEKDKHIVMIAAPMPKTRAIVPTSGMGRFSQWCFRMMQKKSSE